MHLLIRDHTRGNLNLKIRTLIIYCCSLFYNWIIKMTDRWRRYVPLYCMELLYKALYETRCIEYKGGGRWDFLILCCDCWRTSSCVTTIIKIVNNKTNNKQTSSISCICLQWIDCLCYCFYAELLVLQQCKNVTAKCT